MKLPSLRSAPTFSPTTAAGPVGPSGNLFTTATTMRLPALRRPIAQDASFLFASGAVALYDLHNTFGGVGYLAVGAVGLLLGIALTVVVARSKLPLAALPLMVVAMYFLLGGALTLNSLGGSALLPVPNTLSELFQTAVHGWKDVLTTLPPVNGGTLLALPYLLGLTAGAVGMVTATRAAWPPAPLLVTGTLIAVVILIGVQSPTETSLSGALYAGLSVAWLVLRVERGRPHFVTVGKARFSRSVSGGLLCAGVAALAALVGSSLPATGSTRSVFRSSVVPPFNVSQYPSPLVGFRRFTLGYQQVQKANSLYTTPLFKVSGLPAGSLVRIAALDTYDGNVWGAGNVAGSAAGLDSTGQDPASSDTFQKVGQTVADPIVGKPVSATVTILNNAFNEWVPLAGGLTGITFTQPTQLQALNAFRYNLASQTAVLPQGLATGDTYRFSAVLPDAVITPRTQLASGALPGVADYTQFQQLADRWAGHATSSLKQIQNVAAYLKANGRYTDGGSGDQSFAAGHSLYRLGQFVSTSGELAGDDEQFSALMALMANELGVPARVVVGAQLPANGVVTGQDIHAWVELQTISGSWVTLPQTAFMGTIPPKRQTQQAKPSVPASSIPPPAPVQPPANAGQPLSASVYHPTEGNSGNKRKHRSVIVTAIIGVATYVGAPVGAVVLICLTIIGLKLLRRDRRRKHGPPARRVASAWREVLDHARDFGLTAPTVATRREQAVTLGFAGAMGGATLVDSAMFASEPPSDTVAADCWAHLDQLRYELAARYSRVRRIRAAISLSTFTPRRTAAQ